MTRPYKSRLSVPEKAYPLCKIAYAEARRQNVTLEEVEWRAGVLRSTVKYWRRGVAPRQFTVESVLGALGWDISALPHADKIPDGLRRDLEAALKKFAPIFPALAHLPEVSAHTA